MRHVNRVVGADGVERLYLRKKGLPAQRLTQPFGSRALADEVARLIAELTPGAARPGTLGQALRVYELQSAEFRNLAASTKYEYRLLLKEFDEDLGAVAIPHFTPAYVQRLRDLWAARGHRAANVRLQVLKNVLGASLVDGVLEKDPFALVGQVRRPAGLAEPHLIWPAGVLEAVLERAVAEKRYGLARAVALARYVGARRGDLVKLGLRARQAGRFKFRSGKRGVPVDVPEDEELTRWLAAIPATQPAEARQGRKVSRSVTPLPATTLVFNMANGRYTEDGLGLELGKLVAALHKAGKIDSDRYDLHGLRHTRGVELALAGCTDAQGAAQMGHASPSSFAQYRRQADRLQMSDDAAAKVATLRERSPNGEVQNRVQNECKTEPAAGSGQGA